MITLRYITRITKFAFVILIGFLAVFFYVYFSHSFEVFISLTEPLRPLSFISNDQNILYNGYLGTTQ